MKTRFVLAAFFIAIVSVSAFAWDDVGHKLTAYVAWKQMTPEAREKAWKILMAAPEDTQLSTFYLPYNSRSDGAKKLELFMIAATWADIVRDKNYYWRFRKYHKSNWHYTDTLWEDVNGVATKVEDKEDGGKAIEKLKEFNDLLPDAAKKDEEKSIALAWFLHLAGDIHQPLHAAARSTADHKKGDQGGNLFLLSPKTAEKPETLHWYWDSIIARVNPRKNDACDADYLSEIAEKIIKKFPQSKFSSNLKPGAYDDWREESYKIAITEVYKNGLVEGQMPNEKYQKKAFQIAQERIAVAGYRMAEVLNRALSAK